MARATIACTFPLPAPAHRTGSGSTAERSGPIPASRAQPEGVHGPSAVVELPPAWTDEAWRGLPLGELVIYEIHVGTFSPRGRSTASSPSSTGSPTSGSRRSRSCPSQRFPASATGATTESRRSRSRPRTAGVRGPAAPGRRLPRARPGCHPRRRLQPPRPRGQLPRRVRAVLHRRYRTPWGAAINLDGPGSDEVRRYFVENALWWIRDFRFDGLRLDAVHALHDRSPRTFSRSWPPRSTAEARGCGRTLRLIAESDANDPRLVERRERGGIGLDAKWSDDFHHALHARLTGEREGYYADFGSLDDLATALRAPFVYAGRPSAYRGRRHGRPAGDLAGRHFVVCSQNHDQDLDGDAISNEPVWSDPPR